MSNLADTTSSRSGRRQDQDYLWPHLRSLPAFRALIRAIEARLLATLDLTPPVLDIGCGDGHFAQVALGRVDAGLDPDLASLGEAQGRQVYRLLQRGVASALPFADESFPTVISNCVIEHIPDLDGTLSEIHRVLRPGGRFVFSVPTDRLNRNLSGSVALRAVRLEGLARRYEAWFTRMQRHEHLYSPDGWRARMAEHGLQVVWSQGYLSVRGTRLFDLAHYWGLPNLIARRLTGQWVPWAWRPLFFFQEAIWRPLYEETDEPGSTLWFGVAVKDGRRIEEGAG